MILLLIWFYFIGFAILMGGEVNSEIAREIEREAGGRAAAPADPPAAAASAATVSSAAPDVTRPSRPPAPKLVTPRPWSTP